MHILSCYVGLIATCSRESVMCTCVVCMCCCERNDTLDQIYSAAAAEMRDTCSPRWIVYPNKYAWFATKHAEVTTPQQCLLTCIANSTCVAAEWNRQFRECWLHEPTNSQDDKHSTRYYHPNVTQFEIVRECENASGIIILHTLRIVIAICTLYSIIRFQLHVELLRYI